MVRHRVLSAMSGCREEDKSDSVNKHLLMEGSPRVPSTIFVQFVVLYVLFHCFFLVFFAVVFVLF